MVGTRSLAAAAGVIIGMTVWSEVQGDHGGFHGDDAARLAPPQVFHYRLTRPLERALDREQSIAAKNLRQSKMENLGQGTMNINNVA